MQRSNPKVFVSYSWDSREHQHWVIRLTNALRKNGVDASMDAFITQAGTVNLNMMMISQIKSCDYIIVVLTENYALKADEIQGGVGYETILTASYIQENPNKLIPIMRHNGDYLKVFPFHLKGEYSIDFSCDEDFDDRLEELLYKILNTPLYEVEPLGKVPDLKPKAISELRNTAPDNSVIPKLKKITDIEKSRFLQDTYHQMETKFRNLFEQTKAANIEFDYTYEPLTKRKAIFKAYVNGNIRTGLKIWYGSLMSSLDGIYLEYGANIDESNDHSFNEWILCEVKDNTLRLKQTMSIFGNNDKNDIDSIVREIWVNQIKNRLER